MSEKDLIIRLLESAERRIRRNRILNESAKGLAIAMAVPVAFKAIDLFSPFQGTTVAIFLGVWAAATIGWLAWRARGRDSLERTAAKVDQTAGAHDQLKTAYWFIRNPKESDWVEAQIRKAAEDAGKIKVSSLYPRRLPRAGFIAVGLVLLLGVLNFLPLSWNPNWFLLKGAPAFALNDTQKTQLQQALELLKKAEALNQTELADKLAQVIKALQDGSMSQKQLSQSLSELQESLAQGNLNAGQITDGLERIAKALQPSAQTKPIANSLFVLDLKDAAKEVRNLEASVDKSPDAALKEIAERFQDASKVAGSELQQLAQHMADAATALSQRNMTNGKQALEQTAKEFERLQAVLDSQRLRSEASSAIDAVQDSVGGTPGEVGQGEGKGE
ncbi:MAG TPA: hypothetical protein VK210_02140, partial [Terriglobia bacterium]|nr:hypothetical protein [Terriglobia bacterium]